MGWLGCLAWLPCDWRNDMTTERAYTRPLDRSLEAYKAWITRMVVRLGGSDGDDMTDAEWEAAWREFWSDAPEEGKEDG